MIQLLSVLLAVLFSLSAAQFPPPVAYETNVTSPVDSNITIFYKQPANGTCFTVLSTQKQYTGYVNLPPFTLEPYQQDYPINTFFWFIEARDKPESAPLTLWLNGGPGSSSLIGLFQEMGPCEVVPLPGGSYGTQPRLWGWDRSSNLLFIDQPTQVGLSYDSLKNATMDLVDGAIKSPDSATDKAPSWRSLNGTFPSLDDDRTENSTAIAARASWHFLQGWLSVFPQYNPPAGINLYAESYGGQYGPTFASYFEDQNRNRIDNSTLEINLATVGIVNGMVDMLSQMRPTADFLWNNSYEVRGFSDQTSYLNAISSYNRKCAPRIEECRKANDDEFCESVQDECNAIMYDMIEGSGRSEYDIRENAIDSPGFAYAEYLNYPDVLRSVGAQVNFTSSNRAVWDAFRSTGDTVRGTQLQSLADLLRRGIRVALIYGDADIVCNWLGGQNVSLELSRLIPAYSLAFPKAGYADIVVNDTYVGGQVRQYGNLSFSRIYDAGHLVPMYQAETAFTVFTRNILGNDISMGREVDFNFGTIGPPTSEHMNRKIEPQEESICWIRDVNNTCTNDEKNAIFEGKGLAKNGIWIRGDEDEEDIPLPSSSVPVGRPGSLPPSASTSQANQESTTSIPITGVYTATGTPTPTTRDAATSLHAFPFSIKSTQGVVLTAMWGFSVLWLL